MIVMRKEECPARQQNEGGLDDDGDGSPDRSRVQWDGSRAEIVADQNEAFEEQQTGVRISYALKKDEIYDFLREEKTRGKHYNLEITVYAVLTVLLFVQSARLAGQRAASGFFLLLGLCTAALFFAGFLRPVLACRRAAKTGVSDGKTRIAVYPDRIRVGRGKRESEIPLDGSCGCIVTNSVIAIFVPGPGKDQNGKQKFSQTLLLPLRCIDPAVLPEVQAMIFAGTKPESR